jgi:xanthine dehydrogenase accessory factor
VGEVNLLQLLVAEVAAGRRGVLATVVRTDRSVPRRSGAQMVVLEDGTRHGTIGGGEMEARVIDAALSAMTDGHSQLMTYRLVDPASGDPGVCGGEMEIHLETYMPTSTVVIIGAGHVGRAVADLAHWSGFRPIIWDDRAEQILDLPDAVEAHTGEITDALALMPIDSRTAIVIVTRNVGLDRSILPPLLATPAGYIGLMGSQRRWQTTRELLSTDGLASKDLQRIVTPIGLEIGAETPEEIAISILAEIVKSRRGA